MRYRPSELLTNRLLGITLLGRDPHHSEPLQPPWPGLVISAGRRNEPIARWIQVQAGGRSACRLVHVGRPWAPVEAFDLIVTTPQYGLPRHPRILHTDAPMHRISAGVMAEAAARWRPRLAELPAPRTTVLLGGHVGPWTFDPAKARDLGRRIDEMAREAGGSLLISTSVRTPAEVTAALAAGLTVPHRLYRWQRDDPDNPYLGFLALADQVVVTSDSMSMLVEATATGKPVWIYDLADPKGQVRPTLRRLIFHLGRLLGPPQLRRDITAIHQRQIATGRALPLGQPWPDGRRKELPADAAVAAARIKAMFADGGTSA